MSLLSISCFCSTVLVVILNFQDVSCFCCCGPGLGVGLFGGPGVGLFGGPGVGLLVVVMGVDCWEQKGGSGGLACPCL
jgi:hypothetical protein